MDVRVPRAFRAYACERNLVCCGAPILAPVSHAEEAVLKTALATSDMGRSILPELEASVDRTERTWRQSRGRCVHLAPSGEAPGCQLHAAAGLANMPVGCRNFPRIVNQLAPDRYEVTFELKCPTAARLLTEDPAPWSMVPFEGEWHYPATRAIVATGDQLGLRDAWWDVVGDAREDAARLLAAIGAMLATPAVPDVAATQAARISDAAMAPASPMGALLAAQALSSGRARGAAYDTHGQALLDQLMTPWSKRALVAAIEATPEYVAAFLEHGIALLAMFEPEHATRLLELTARRALAVIRLVDTACTRVPFRTPTLFADAYQAVARLDPMA